jgi:CDI immunity proteins
VDKESVESWPPRFASAPAGRDSRTLVDIEGVDWGKPTFDSNLVVTCHGLRHKPLGTFTVEDLRIMIGQKISLPILVPMALRRLQEDPLAEGLFYSGDLLRSLLGIDEAFWQSQQEALETLRHAANRALDGLAKSNLADPDHGDLVEAVRRFLFR